MQDCEAALRELTAGQQPSGLTEAVTDADGKRR
jgi:hypothetical protein